MINSLRASQSGLPWDALNGWVPLAGLAAGGAYALGYLIVNLYLSRYGVGSLNLVQARYFTAGLLYMILSALVLSGTFISVQAIRQPAPSASGGRRWVRVALVLTADLLLTLVIIWAAGQILTGGDRTGPFVQSLSERRLNFWAGLSASQIALGFPLALGAGLRWLLGRLRPASDAAPPSWLGLGLLASSLFAFCLAISLFIFAVFVYPAVSAAFGGGAPVRVQLLFKQPATPAALELATTPAGLTAPLTLIDQTETQVMILDTQQRLLEFALDDLAAVVR